MDILEIVVQPTWREFLVELIESEQMNPWDIDLCAVADAYLKKIRRLQALDLRIPANVILASALLLRFKADALRFDEEVEEVEAPPELIQEELPELVLKPSRPRPRRVSLHELIAAIQEVMRDGKKIFRIEGAPAVLELGLSEQDLHEKMKEVYECALALKDSENILLFSALVQASIKEKECVWSEVVIEHLIPVLHLVQEEKLLAWQDKVFGEIFLKIL